jgi:hypothetical protein
VTNPLLSLFTYALLAALPDVTVRPLEGESVRGKLTALSLTNVTIETIHGEQRLEATRLLSVEFPAKSSISKPAAWIELMDDSKVVATAFTASAGKARCEQSSQPAIELPTRAVRTVRFHSQTPDVAAQWREITSSQPSGDLLVIRKTATRTVEQGDAEPRTVSEQSLDQLEGTILEVTSDRVVFELEGEKVPVRREKLEGIVFYQSAKREFAPAVARVVDASASHWLVSNLELSPDRLRATTRGGVPLEFPIATLMRIDYAVGNVAFLADLEPDSGIGELPLSLQSAAMDHKYSRLFQSRTSPPLGASGFRIGGQQFENGLSLHSPVKLVYRVPQGFRTLKAVAGVDDSIVAPGRFNLVISGDGKELLRQAFSPEEQRKAVPLNIDLNGVRRITIGIESDKGQDIGDRLDLCEARFTK